jgi:hypothetical protein
MEGVGLGLQRSHGLRPGDRDEARRIYEAILERYPDAQDIRERMRSM